MKKVDEQAFESGMAAKLEGDKLVWVDDGQWICVDDLPKHLIDEMMVQPCYAATAMCEDYLNDNNDEPVNDCGA